MGQAETYDQLIALGIDMENDFFPGGKLGVDKGDEVIDPYNAVVRYVRSKGGEVIYTRDNHPANSRHFEIWPPHGVIGTEGAEFHPRLEVLEGDVIINKGMGVEEDAYSGFDGRDDDGRSLAEVINFKRKKRLVIIIGGLATDYCVKATTLDALKLAQEVKSIAVPLIVVIKDAIRAVNLKQGEGDRAIEEMKKAGAIFLSSDEIINGALERL